MKSSKSSSSNQAFRELAAKAADFERSGNGDAAYNCWRKAAAYSNSEANRVWCEVRAEFVKSRHYQVTMRKAA